MCEPTEETPRDPKLPGFRASTTGNRAAQRRTESPVPQMQTLP